MLKKNESVRIEVEVVCDRFDRIKFKELSTGKELYWWYTNRPSIREYELGSFITIEAIRNDGVDGNILSRVKYI